MVKTFRSSKVMKFIDQLRRLRQLELEHALIFGNYFRGQFRELFENSDFQESDDLYHLIDTITKHSYEEGSLSLSHSQLSFFHETMFHLGGTTTLETVIKEMGDFFDLDIPERNIRKSDLESYRIKSVDTRDYSLTPRDFYLIVGGMDESFSEEVRDETAQHCREVLLKFLHADAISQTNNGFIIQTPLQNIPNLSAELINHAIGIYGIIPIEDMDNK